jgi:hypothetical protein
MTELKQAEPIAIVDMANLRDDSGSGGLFRRERRDQRVISSWAFIDSVLSSLNKVVPNLTLVPVFDAGLANNFKGEDIAVTHRRRQLNHGDEDFIYFMKEHRIEADPLILKIAEELHGFVVSGDKYEKYSTEITNINENVFIPIKNAASGEFVFFKSSDFYELRLKQRNFDGAIENRTRTLDQFIASGANFRRNDFAVREQVFGTNGVVDRFWAINFSTSKPGERDALKSGIFKDLSMFEFFRNAFSKNESEKVVKEEVSKPKRRVIKKRFKPAVLFCDALDHFDANVDSQVEIVGKLGRSGEQIFLEWYRGDKTVLISDFTTRKDLDKSFIKISGFLSKGFEHFELAINEDTNFERLSFADAAIHRLSRLDAYNDNDEPRRWYLPSLRWGEKVTIPVLDRPKAESILPPPPGYRYRTAEEQLSEMDSELIQAKGSSANESDISSDRPTDRQIFESEEAIASVVTTAELPRQNGDSVEDERPNLQESKRARFELSDVPGFGRGSRRRRSQSRSTASRARFPKWLYLVLLAIAIGVAYLAKVQYFETFEKSTVVIQVANASGTSGSAGQMTIELKDLGYIVRPAIWVKDRATSKQVTTVVYFLPGSEAAAKEVARELGGVEVAKSTGQIPTNTNNLGEVNVVILLGSDIAGKPLGTAIAELPAGQTRYKCWGAIEQICVEI